MLVLLACAPLVPPPPEGFAEATPLKVTGRGGFDRSFRVGTHAVTDVRTGERVDPPPDDTGAPARAERFTFTVEGTEVSCVATWRIRRDGWPSDAVALDARQLDCSAGPHTGLVVSEHGEEATGGLGNGDVMLPIVPIRRGRSTVGWTIPRVLAVEPGPGRVYAGSDDVLSVLTAAALILWEDATERVLGGG